MVCPSVIPFYEVNSKLSVLGNLIKVSLLFTDLQSYSRQTYRSVKLKLTDVACFTFSPHLKMLQAAEWEQHFEKLEKCFFDIESLLSSEPAFSNINSHLFLLK